MSAASGDISHGGPARSTRIGFSDERDTEVAARAALSSVAADASAVTFLFYSPEHDPAVAARVLQEVAGDAGVGGSTAGEIAGDSFHHGTMVAFSISNRVARASVRAFGNVDAASLVPFRSLGADLAERLGHSIDDLDPSRHLWLGLFDGLGAREEMLVPFFARHAADIPLVGGSLGDEDRMEQVTLIHDGQVHRSGAAIMLLEYDRPFRLFHHTHHRLSEERFAVTEVTQGGRVIVSLNGRPAARVYAEALGVTVDGPDDILVSSHPLGYRFRGRAFPCSVMRIDDESLLMAYGVQEGEHLNVLEPKDIVTSTRQALSETLASFRSDTNVEPEAMLTFHCLGRYREARQLRVVDQLYDAMNQLPLVGLNTYGEQFGSMHMNHSVTGVIFG